jgi:hypothetical protein
LWVLARYAGSYAFIGFPAMAKVTEKELDKAIEEAFKSDPNFTRWFLSKTKFSSENATYHWSRSDHPWSRVEILAENPKTGVVEKVIKEGETDILVVFQTDAGRKVAIHLENKIAAGKFTLGQPELYVARAESWVGNPKYCSYEDYEIILIAPLAFYERNTIDAKKFGCYVAHEEIAAYIPIFSQLNKSVHVEGL